MPFPMLVDVVGHNRSGRAAAQPPLCTPQLRRPHHPFLLRPPSPPAAASIAATTLSSCASTLSSRVALPLPRASDGPQLSPQQLWHEHHRLAVLLVRPVQILRYASSPITLSARNLRCRSFSPSASWCDAWPPQRSRSRAVLPASGGSGHQPHLVLHTQRMTHNDKPTQSGSTGAKSQNLILVTSTSLIVNRQLFPASRRSENPDSLLLHT